MITVSIDTKTATPGIVHGACMMLDISNGDTVFLHGEPADIRAFANRIVGALPHETFDAKPQEAATVEA